MSAVSPPSPILQQFIALLREMTGNLVPPGRYGFLEEVAQRRAKSVGCASVADYVRALAAGELPREWGSLVSLITIKESYFYRAPQQFEAIRRCAVPALVAARAESRKLCLWTAACARGEEPATLALLLIEEPSLVGWDWVIRATDLDEEALEVAERGLYGERAVSQVPPEILERYFRRRGKLYELSSQIRERIDYRAVNLATPPYDLPEPAYDLILLRNLLIYFRRPLQTRVMGHVAQRLSPDGYFFLGATETLWQIQDELEAVDLGDCFCYRHRQGPPPPRTQRTARTARTEKAEEKAEKKKEKTGHGEVGAALVRARGVSRLPAAGAPAASPPAPSVEGAGDRTPLVPAGVPERLLAAARQLAANRPEEARRLLDAILASDPGEPAAHGLDGFLHDLAGRLEEAVASYRSALYLDPALFEVRLLLADGLLRLGQTGRAEHQYREVLTLLEGGRKRHLVIFDDLPLPDRERALRRCRQALAGAPRPPSP